MNLLIGATLATVCTLTATGAGASSIDDGKAGLEALDRGAYPEAVQLFTKALNAGDLSPDDREFAFLNRGKAYLGSGDRVHALADLQQAVRLRPDDGDAREALAHGTHAGFAPCCDCSASARA